MVVDTGSTDRTVEIAGQFGAKVGDAVKINEKELEAIYQFDAAFFDLAEQVGRALDNVEQSLGDDAALPAAIRNLATVARLAVETYEKRAEVVNGSK